MSWRLVEIVEGKRVNAQTWGSVHPVPERVSSLGMKAKDEVLVMLALLSVF